jgi:glutamate-1-semialdehyde aminotransferase
MDQRGARVGDVIGAVRSSAEIKAGFALRTGGYQAFAEIVPDLAAFGKAMANGFPLSAVCGHRDIMDAARKTWISSTLASEGAALAAAGAVLAWHDAADVCESLAVIGADMRGAIARAVEAAGVDGLTIAGLDQMWLLQWTRRRASSDSSSFRPRTASSSSEARTTFRRSPDENAIRTSRLGRGALVELRDEEEHQ